jgi:hypothetical protein
MVPLFVARTSANRRSFDLGLRFAPLAADYALSGCTLLMVGRHLFRSALHQHADPAQRVIGIAELPPDSGELAALLADPVPEVRIAAAKRCADLGALGAALANQSDATVRDVLVSALSALLSKTPDSARAIALLESDGCTDEIRAEVARRTQDAARRRGAIAAIREEDALIELALTAEHAETRMAAAERVHTPQGLSNLADAASNKDRGVTRAVRSKIDAIAIDDARAAEADTIAGELETLVAQPGPILSRVVELNRRWQALNLSNDSARLARCEAARQTLQARLDREQLGQQVRARFQHRLDQWLLREDPPATADTWAAVLGELAALREEGRKYADALVLSRLDDASQRIEKWVQELQVFAEAEALVIEAEQLSAGTSIDDAQLPQRWQALDRRIRTPALTRRFEAALIVVEQRRLKQVQAAQQETHSARQQVHTFLHSAEQALAAGQLQAARAAANEIRAHRAGAGMLPKPTLQRLSRLIQQLTELERWESFGQHQARVRLCERAEAVSPTLHAPQIAVEVQTLRSEWKALDQQHADVPKALKERFDRACERAYAPAARYFAEKAALRKQAREQREQFIATTAAQAQKLLLEPLDFGAIAAWLRDSDRRWRDGELGSVEPKAWRRLDEELNAVLAPLRDALSAARDQAKARRLELLGEVTALAARATQRDAPARVKEIQAKWQAQTKEFKLAAQDERALWERFRAACNAVFQARDAKRKQEDDRKHEVHQALENICVQLEQLVQAPGDDQQMRRRLRDLQEQWTRETRAPNPAPRSLETRFANAKTAAEGALSARARAREAAVWQTLLAKERLCEELERLLYCPERSAETAPTVTTRWVALPTLPLAWEGAMLARRDAALHALEDLIAARVYRSQIERGIELRREILLEIELLLGLECPPELQAQRLALQVKHLRERFRSAGKVGPARAAERLLAWCSEPGVVDARDRERCERVFLAIERAR